MAILVNFIACAETLDLAFAHPDLGGAAKPQEFAQCDRDGESDAGEQHFHA